MKRRRPNARRAHREARPCCVSCSSSFRAAMLDGDDDAAAAARVRRRHRRRARGWPIYRHHVFTSLTAALEATYPVVVRLVDPASFASPPTGISGTHPPSSPCLFEYGATLGEFLARFAPSQPLVYLPDVARLEWAMNVALHAPDAALIERAALARGPTDRPPPVGHPAAIAVAGRRHLARQPGRRPPTTAWISNAGGVRLQVWRAGDEVLFRSLSPAEPSSCATPSCAPARWRRPRAKRWPLDAGADLAAHIVELLAEEVLIERS